MATWDTIKAYQRAAFKPQAAQMDAIGFPASFGSTSGSDGQQISNHNLSATITDSNGVVWTATSVGAAPSGNQQASLQEFVTGTLTASNNQLGYTQIQKPQDATLTGSGGHVMAD